MKSLVVAVALLLILILTAYWWANAEPSRPSNVASDAVFLWKTISPLPGSPRGQWFHCWYDQAREANVCRLSTKDGEIVHEGTYSLFPDRTPVSEVELKIDAGQTTTSWVAIGEVFVPWYAYLTDGRVLIADEEFEKGAEAFAQHGI